jgi:hypothetical protein
VICFYWEPPELIKENPKAVKKLLLHWTHTAKCFGIKTIYCVGQVEVKDKQIDFRCIKSLDELPNIKKVFVEQGGKPLGKFKHPKKCIYIFGSDYDKLPKADVSIDSKLGLYAEQACAIILHDRYINGRHQ